LKVAPDFVLLELYVNSFETAAMRRPSAYPLLPAAQHAWMMESSLAYQILNGRWGEFQEAIGFTESYAEYLSRHLRDPNAPDSREAFGQLRQFIERARGAGVPTGAVLFPAADSMGAYGANYPFGFLGDHVAAVCAEEKIRCLDLLPAFSTFRDPRSLWVSPFDAHPNAQANRRAAAEILQAFRPIWPG
jgi:hypothetical protein